MLSIAFALLFVTAAPRAAAQAGDPVRANAEFDLVKELDEKRDSADAELMNKVAAFKTPSAAKALVDLYGKLASLWSRREVLRVLREFDGEPAAGSTALDCVATVAANAWEPELRDAAFDTLAHCPRLGRTYLAKLVELPLQEQVRERAIDLHAAADAAVTEAARKEDAAWYRRIYGDEKLPKKLREKAFTALAATLDANELAKFFHDAHDGTIRRIALEAMQKLNAPAVADLALETLKTVTVLPTDRAHAAAVLAAVKGPKAADALIDVALQQATSSYEMREAIADLLAQMNDPAVNKRLLALVGTGKPHEQWFALMATRHLLAGDEKLLKKVRSTLDEKDGALRRVAIRILGEQKDQGSAELLEKALKKPKEPEDAPALILALSRIRAENDKDGAWEKRLVELAGDADRDRRNAALQALASGANAGKHLPSFVAGVAHADWTTRLIALAALEKLRDRDSLGPIIAQMQKESGRTLIEFGNALFRLTGEPHDTNAPTWQKWWNDVGKGLPLLDPAGLDKKLAERERRRLQQTTNAPQFFGVRIESHDVAFVVDISGSMAETLQSTQINGKPATRIDVLKQELVKSLKSLDPTALFNLISFSSGVTKWKEGVVPNTDKTRAEAVDWVEHLGSRGGTNIYQALETAFADPRVDTIFLLTDGEPSTGNITDLVLLREHVARLNETRHVKIHCIGVGGDFPLLEWIAKDSGGNYVKFN